MWASLHFSGWAEFCNKSQVSAHKLKILILPFPAPPQFYLPAALLSAGLMDAKLCGQLL